MGSVSNAVSKVTSPVTKVVPNMSKSTQMNILKWAPVAVGGPLVKPITDQLINRASADQVVNNRTGGGSPTAGYPAVPGSSSSGSSSSMDSGISNINSAPNSVNTNLKPNTQALDELRNEALTPSSDSPWLKNQLQQIALDRQNSLDAAAKSGAGQNAQAMTALASHGGLSSGAAERVADEGMKNNLLSQQGVYNNANAAGLTAAQTAEQNRLSLLQGLPSAEIAQLQPQEWSAQTQLQQMAMQQQQAWNEYNAQMQQQGAAANAAAIANPGNPSLFGKIVGSYTG